MAASQPRFRIIVAGSSQHIGRQLSSAVCDGNQVVAIVDRSQAACGAPVHPNISWFKADVADQEAVRGVFGRIQRTGGADLVIYLGADRTDPLENEEWHRRIDIEGLRNVLEASNELRVTRFFYATPELDEREESPSSPPLPGIEKLEASVEDILARFSSELPTSRIGLTFRPRVIITGASGFVGRHLLDDLKEDFEIFGLARSSQARCGAPIHPSIGWFQVDISDGKAVDRVFSEIRRSGGADIVIHLAAYYDFSGDDHPQYQQTNVDGLRNILDSCRALKPKKFIFASSVGACDFPKPGGVLNEDSPTDGKHPYAVTKRVGEEMLAEYSDDFSSVIVRLAAIYSDWCEYPPLFMSLNTWLSKDWSRRILGGRGDFGLPYLHVRDAATFMKTTLGRVGDLAPLEVLIASLDGVVSTRELFEMATRCHTGEMEMNKYLPKQVCGLGLLVKDLAGRILGERPFERPWMAKYIDMQMPVDASRTRQRLGWSPRERLNPVRRLPFLIENLKNHPLDWHRRNQAVLDKIRPTTNLRIHQLMEKHEDTIYKKMAMFLDAPVGKTVAAKVGLRPEEMQWNLQLILHQLMNAIRARDMSIYMSFCADLATRRFAQGLLEAEVCSVLEALKQTCLLVILPDPEAKPLDREIREHLEITTLFGCDQVQETYEELRGSGRPG